MRPTYQDGLAIDGRLDPASGRLGKIDGITDRHSRLLRQLRQSLRGGMVAILLSNGGHAQQIYETLLEGREAFRKQAATATTAAATPAPGGATAPPALGPAASLATGSTQAPVPVTAAR